MTAETQVVDAVETQAPAVETAPAPAKKTATKGAAKKPAAKKAPAKATKAKGKPAAKTTKKATAKKSEGKAKAPKAPATKGGLRLYQVRALKAVQSRALPLPKMSEVAGISTAVLRLGIGSLDPDQRKADEAEKGFKTLLGLKYLTASQHEIKGRDTTVYEITPAGTAALAEWTAENGRSLDAPRVGRWGGEAAPAKAPKKARKKAAK